MGRQRRLIDEVHGLMGLGRFAEAESALVAAIKADPTHHAAFNLLALLACHFRRFDVAEPAAMRAAQLAPAVAAYHTTLGRIWKGLGKTTEAERALRRSLEIEPRDADAQVLLGIVLKTQGKLDEAIAAYQAALALRSDFPEARINLANALRERGEAENATRLYREAADAAPHLAEAQSALTAMLLSEGREREALDQVRRTADLHPHLPQHQFLRGLLAQKQGGAPSESIEAYRRVLEQFPDHADAWVNLGVALAADGRLEDATACYRRALDIDPAHLAGLNNYGLALAAYSRHAEAATVLRQAVERDGQYLPSLINLGGVLVNHGLLTEAETVLRRALALDPRSIEARTNLGAALRSPGRLGESVEVLRQAVADHPEHGSAHDNLLFSMLYADGVTAEAFVTAARHWGQANARPLPPPVRSLPARRRLRIGYVSPDLRRHSVAYFFEPVLVHHDPNAFETFCYHLSPVEDDVSLRLRQASEHWCNAHGLATEVLAQRVRDDGIDILVDLAGRTGQHHLGLFAARPAPVQMTWLGFPSTVGEPSIGYRITDWQVDPKGYERFNTEQPLRLPHSYFCYRPGGAPGIGPVPSATRTEIVFASFNNLMKVSDATLRLWARVLLAVPASRLLLKNKVLAEESVCRRLRDLFADAGVDPARLDLRAWTPEIADHLELYNQVDVALDTYPYNGATTTCEALWMGVPVVSRCGDVHASRMGRSILQAAGYPRWVAESDDEFVAIAAGLAGNVEGRSRLRREVRQVLSASPLMDERVFTRHLEDLFRFALQDTVGG